MALLEGRPAPPAFSIHAYGRFFLSFFPRSQNYAPCLAACIRVGLQHRIHSALLLVRHTELFMEPGDQRRHQT